MAQKRAPVIKRVIKISELVFTSSMTVPFRTELEGNFALRWV